MMKIHWSESAIDSLKAIKEFIANDSEFYSKFFTENIINHVEVLKEFPSIGSIVPEYNQSDIREIIFGNYRIVYRMYENRITVLNIIHASRDFENA